MNAMNQYEIRGKRLKVSLKHEQSDSSHTPTITTTTNPDETATIDDHQADRLHTNNSQDIKNHDTVMTTTTTTTTTSSSGDDDNGGGGDSDGDVQNNDQNNLIDDLSHVNGNNEDDRN
jgi:hypothetical protein